VFLITALSDQPTSAFVIKKNTSVKAKDFDYLVSLLDAHILSLKKGTITPLFVIRAINRKSSITGEFKLGSKEYSNISKKMPFSNSVVTFNRGVGELLKSGFITRGTKQGYFTLSHELDINVANYSTNNHSLTDKLLFTDTIIQTFI
jgi:hypothetical protein